MNFIRKKQTAVISFASSDLEGGHHRLAGELKDMALPEQGGEVILQAPTAVDIGWDAFADVTHFAERAEKLGLTVQWNLPEQVLEFLGNIGFGKSGGSENAH